MSAWAEIVNAKGDDDWLQTCDLAMREIQRVALHRAAEQIRAEEARMKRDFVLDENEGWAAADAADLIDPEVT